MKDTRTGFRSCGDHSQQPCAALVHSLIVVAAGVCGVARSAETLPQVHDLIAVWHQAESQFGHGHMRDAEMTLRRALPVSDEEKAGTALRLGVVLIAGGDTLDAAAQLDAAAALAASLPPADRAQLFLARGGLAARIGDFVTAEQRFVEGAALARSAGAASNAVRGELNALRARMDRRELASLDARLAAAHAMVLRLPTGDAHATLLIADGELHRRAVNEFRSDITLRRTAYESFDRARQYAQTSAIKAQALGSLGTLYEDEGRWSEAAQLTSQAIFMSQASEDASQLYRWEWQAARIQRQQGQFEQSTASMDRALIGLANIRNDVLKSSRQAFSTLVEPVYLDYADISLRRAALLTEGSEAQQQVLRSVRNQLESLKQAEVLDYFANQCAVGDASTGDPGFRVAGTAVMYPILLPDRLEVLVETNGVLRRFPAAVSRGEATFTTRQLRLSLERASSGDVYLAPAQALYRWLMTSAEPWLSSRGVNTIVFVPSGALRTIPLGALHDGQRFLIQKYAIATTPAVSLVTAARAAPIERMFLGGLTRSVQGFAGLPGVAEEMRRVSSIVPVQSLQDETFQLDAVRSQLSTANFSVAHLATHGEFNSDYQQSFILTFDNRLTMSGLRSALNRRATPLDLLVLSACQTAAGDDRAALGLAGVAIQAGARSALASLWSISDTATADLMTKFYAGSQTAGTTKAESLRQAQIALLESAQYSHPAYWAPYLLIGNWL